MIRDNFGSGPLSVLKGDMSVLKIKAAVGLDKVERLFYSPGRLFTRKSLDFKY
jgi:hypothetical protein